MIDNQSTLTGKFTLDQVIKLLFLILIIIIVNYLYSNYNEKRKNSTPKFVQVDLVKITTDYTQKAILLVTNLNSENNLSQEQKMAKAQNVMKIVGASIESILNDYSKANKVIIFQKQMIASDAGVPLKDITKIIEDKIDERINPNDIHNAAQK